MKQKEALYKNFMYLRRSNHHSLYVYPQMWPVLSNVCSTYQRDVRVMERCCRCIRFAVRCVGKFSTHLLEPIVKQVFGFFDASNRFNNLVFSFLSIMHIIHLFLYRLYRYTRYINIVVFCILDLYWWMNTLLIQNAYGVY